MEIVCTCLASTLGEECGERVSSATRQRTPLATWGSGMLFLSSSFFSGHPSSCELTSSTHLPTAPPVVMGKHRRRNKKRRVSSVSAVEGAVSFPVPVPFAPFMADPPLLQQNAESDESICSQALLDLANSSPDAPAPPPARGGERERRPRIPDTAASPRSVTSHVRAHVSRRSTTSSFGRFRASPLGASTRSASDARADHECIPAGSAARVTRSVAASRPVGVELPRSKPRSTKFSAGPVSATGRQGGRRPDSPGSSKVENDGTPPLAKQARQIRSLVSQSFSLRQPDPDANSRCFQLHSRASPISTPATLTTTRMGPTTPRPARHLLPHLAPQHPPQPPLPVPLAWHSSPCVPPSPSSRSPRLCGGLASTTGPARKSWRSPARNSWRRR